MHEHGVELEQLEAPLEQQLAGGRGEPRRGSHVERRAAAPATQERGRAQAEERALDALGGGGQWDHRGVVEQLGPHAARRHHQARNDPARGR